MAAAAMISTELEPLEQPLTASTVPAIPVDLLVESPERWVGIFSGGLLPPRASHVNRLRHRYARLHLQGPRPSEGTETDSLTTMRHLPARPEHVVAPGGRHAALAHQSSPSQLH